jgi:hypothetical protein
MCMEEPSEAVVCVILGFKGYVFGVACKAILEYLSVTIHVPYEDHMHMTFYLQIFPIKTAWSVRN